MQEEKQNSELKKLARSAKNRLKNGYWQGSSLGTLGKPNEENSIFGYSNEEEMYAKVKDMLTKDECVMNPLGKLMDMKLYESMQSADKARYVLAISKIYRKLQERYYREKKRQNAGD